MLLFLSFLINKLLSVLKIKISSAATKPLHVVFFEEGMNRVVTLGFGVETSI